MTKWTKETFNGQIKLTIRKFLFEKNDRNELK